MDIADLELSTLPTRGRYGLGPRVGALIALQLAIAVGVAIVVELHGCPIGRPSAVLALTACFVVAGAFAASLELNRHNFTFTPSDAVLVVGFLVAGPIGLAVSFAVGEAVNSVAQRRDPLKSLFNVSNRLAAAMLAAGAFQAIGHTSMHDMMAWVAALAAAVLFSLLDVAATSLAISIAEQTEFHVVFVRSAATGVLATLAAAPIGLVALDLFSHGPVALVLVVPLAAAVTINSRYAVAQRDEHLRIERLHESTARTAGLLSLDHALESLAAEARALTTGSAALCCVVGANDTAVGAWADDGGAHRADPDAIAAAAELARTCPDGETAIDDASCISSISGDARNALVASSLHEHAGRVVLVVFRDGTSATGANSRVELLGAFANHAALIVANAMMHEEVAVALARQVDLNRQKDDFVAAVSHELRTPLAVILGSVQTLDRLDGKISDTQRAQLFDMTSVQGARLQRLIDELLLVAAAEHANVRIEHDAIDIAKLTASVAADTAVVTKGRLERRIDDDAQLVTDASKLAQVLMNLVENAAKYAPSGPIELTASREADGICFRVVDHGPGIPPEDRERIFERFVQLDQSSTRRQGGTGLGLHLCNQIAKLLDGRLDIEETSGGGCTFALHVPAVPSGARPTTGCPTSIRVAPATVRVRPAGLRCDAATLVR